MLSNTVSGSLTNVSSFYDGVKIVQQAIARDFGEPLVHPIHSMNLQDMEEEEDGMGQTTQTETRRELEEGLELRERYLVQTDKA